MKHVLMFVLQGCPHCRRAFEMLDDIYKRRPELAKVSIEVVDERKDRARAKEYEYWYVPAIFVDGVKMQEGVPKIEEIEAALEAALDMKKVEV